MRCLSERSAGDSSGKAGASAAPDGGKSPNRGDRGKDKEGKGKGDVHGGKDQAQSTRNSDKNKFSSTVFLPTTAFPMRANAAERERDIMKFSCDKLYRWQSEAKRAGARRVIIHDGPPYANGALHIGHLLNRVLKDVLVRRHILKGNVVSFIPGWDCHGLPIELNALKQLLAKPPPTPPPSTAPAPPSSSASPPSPTPTLAVSASVIEVAADPIASKDPRSVRSAAHALARATIQQHLVETDRWHLAFDPKSIYTTMDPQYEAAQLRVFGQMLQKGLVFRGMRPVHWSPSSRTALAEAELEYNDAHTSAAVHVAFDLDFPAVNAGHAPLMQRLAAAGVDFSAVVSFVAWTTTPWTVPANQALCVHEKFEYALCARASSGEGEEGGMSSGCVIVLAAKVEALTAQLGLMGPPLATAQGAELVGLPYVHPMTGQRHRVLHAGHVTADVGTGIVHTAPAHGFDDYDVGVSSGLLCACLVDDDGRYTQEAGQGLQGKSVLGDGAAAVMQSLQASGHLLSRSNFVHKCCNPPIAAISCVGHSPNAHAGTPTTGVPSYPSSSAQQNRCCSRRTCVSPPVALTRCVCAVVRRPRGTALARRGCLGERGHGACSSTLAHDGLPCHTQPLVHQPPTAVGRAHSCTAQH